MALSILVYAGEQVLRVPETTDVSNSQTMHLLEGYLNINPTSTGGVEIAIADGVALESNGGNGEAFVELGKSGAGQISIYIVREGDTLSEIAEMFDVSVNTIIWANDLRGSTIKEGQELVILPLSGVRHLVKSGDTLQSIASKYKADVGDIRSYNGLAIGTKIKSGDIVVVPGGVISAIQTTVAKTSGAPSSQSYLLSKEKYLCPIIGGRKSQGLHDYGAVDWAAPVGTPIRAATDGKVVIAKASGYNGGYGWYVVISHPNGVQTLYAHMSRIAVLVGQGVEKSQLIGAVGNTGRSTGPHVHFEVRGDTNPC